MERMVALVLTVILLITCSTLVGSAGIVGFLGKGDKFLYEIDYYSNGVVIRKSYFQIRVVDEYISTEQYFDFEITYINATGSVSKNFTAVRIFQLSQYLPLLQTGYSTEQLTVSLPIPVDDWNNVLEPGSPIAAKILYLSLDSRGTYNFTIENRNVAIDAMFLSGHEGGYYVKAVVDSSNNLLISLKVFDKYGEPIYSISLIYSNKYLETSSEVEHETTTVNRGGFSSRIILVIVLALISVFALLAVSSYFGRF